MPFLWRVPGPATPRRPSKWYFSTSTLVTAVLFLGPLALPLVWLNPRYKIATKLLITTLILGLTLAALYLMVDMYRRVMEQIHALGVG